jgi:hypothetical protein
MFRDTMTRWLINVIDEKSKLALRTLLEPLFDRASSVCLQSPGMVISAGGAVTAKTGASDTYLVANGVLVKVAASTTLPVLTGINAAQNAFIIACFFVDQAGTITVAGGTAGTTIALAKFPQFPKGKALLGSLLITNAGGVFTGNTTPLDTAVTVYINGPETFDPACIVGAFLP